MGVIQEFTHIATPEENSYIESFFSSLERELLQRTWFDSLFQARLKLREYFNLYNFRRKHRSLRRRSPYRYVQAFFPEFADKHPFAFSDSLSGLASENVLVGAATCLDLDKEGNENGTFVESENKEILLN